jgi:homocysteine S-methyltransferase
MEEEGIEIPAWFSFSCKDENNVASGESILECASIADSCKQVVAVGVNCTAPRFIHGLISSIKKVLLLYKFFCALHYQIILCDNFIYFQYS